jgi:hypothetical protein
MATGRPTSYKPEYCDKLVEHMADGNSFETFGATIGVCRDSLYTWEKKYPDFSDAKRLGREKALSWWEKVGKLGMMGKIKGFVPAIWIFSVKNRFGWTDKVEISNDTEKPLVLKYKA